MSLEEILFTLAVYYPARRVMNDLIDEPIIVIDYMYKMAIWKEQNDLNNAAYLAQLGSLATQLGRT